jgi:hypothetical protein
LTKQAPIHKDDECSTKEKAFMMKTCMPKLKGKAKLSRQSRKFTSRKMLKMSKVVERKPLR